MKRKVIHFKRKPNRWKQNIISWVKRDSVLEAISFIIMFLITFFGFIYMIMNEPF